MVAEISSRDPFVFGVGLSRTGTKSLQDALSVLYPKKIYHFEEIFYIKKKHLDLWFKALEDGDLSKEEWDEIFSDYDGGVDNPVKTFYKQLMKHYPNAKFVLTVRNKENWYKSFLYHHQAVGTLFENRIVKSIFKLRAGAKCVKFMEEHMKIEFLGGPSQPDDKEFTINGYEKWIETVKETIPAERLLVYDVRQGWEPLCNFLDKEIPNYHAFPHSNTRAHLKGQIKRVTNAPILFIYASILTLFTLLAYSYLAK